MLRQLWYLMVKCYRTKGLFATAFLFLWHGLANAAAPVAFDDAFFVGSNLPFSGLVGLNDSGLDGPSDVFTLGNAPLNGTTTLNPDGSFTYIPNVGYLGEDEFTYTINDGAGGTSSATVSLTVEPGDDFITVAEPLLITTEDTPVPLNISVAQDLFEGGNLQDIISTDVLFRPDNGGATPLVSVVPSSATGVVITGFSTQSLNTAGNDNDDDDYQLLNVRIDLTSGVSSGRLANLVDGRLSLLNQYSWENVILGQSVLSDPSKVIGFNTGANAPNPIFSLVGDELHIVENHSLETIYHIEYTTSENDSTNFLGATSSVQVGGVTTSTLDILPGVEPSTGKQGIVVLNGYSATGGSFRLEHKGFSRLVIDFETNMISGVIAALRGETEQNTVTYGFKEYPLVDLRKGIVPTSDIIAGSALVIGDTTSKAEVLDNPTVYINTAGQLVVERTAAFAGPFTTMYTAENYERTGFSSIASFVAVDSDDTIFNSDFVPDTDGTPANEFRLDVPASAKVGLAQMSWNTIGGNDTNENVGFGFAVIDFSNQTTSGSITFIRATTPDLISWGDVPLGETIFGSTDASGNPLFESNKEANNFTDLYGRTARFTFETNADGSQSLVFTANNGNGTQNFRRYRGNIQVSWLGSEAFGIEGVPVTGFLSHGAPLSNGDWQIDFSELPLLSYIPQDNVSEVIDLNFTLSSTGETEFIQVHIEPVVDEVALSTNDTAGYIDIPFPLLINTSAMLDTDGSETGPSPWLLEGIPASMTLSSSAGTVTSLGGGDWEISDSAIPTLQVISSSPTSATVTISATQEDQFDLDGNGVIDDFSNSVGADEFDVVQYSENFRIDVFDIPTVVSQSTNQQNPVITGTVVLVAGESFTVTVNGETYTNGDGNLVVNSNGTWVLTIPAGNAIPQGTYSVVAQKSHTIGTAGVDTTNAELIIDLSLPSPATVINLATSDATPIISGTLPITGNAVLTVEVNGVTYSDGDGNLSVSGGNWSLSIPANNALAEGVYDVNAIMTNNVGSFSLDSSAEELLVDFTSPVIPTVDPLIINTTTPVLSGTAILEPAEQLSVVVNGVTYLAGDGNLFINSDGTWNLTIPAADALPEDTYSVVATVVDLVGNTSVDISASELTVDLTPPIMPTVNDHFSVVSTPVFSGTATVGFAEVLTVLVNGELYTAGDGNLVNNVDGTWTITIPAINALNDDFYEVLVSVADPAGNVTQDNTAVELRVLTMLSPPTVNDLLESHGLPTITGNASLRPGDILEVTINEFTYTAGDGFLVANSDETWTLTIPLSNELDDGFYQVEAKTTGNDGSFLTDSTDEEVEVDTRLAPPVFFDGDNNLLVFDGFDSFLEFNEFESAEEQNSNLSLSSNTLTSNGESLNTNLNTIIALDIDGDGVQNDQDFDADNDGLPNAIEGNDDSDADGVANYLDGDSDNDGLADIIEVGGEDVDGDFQLDDFIDLDNNGQSDNVQALALALIDTDSDRVPNYLDIDSDNDGFSDLVENAGIDADNNGQIDNFIDNDNNGIDDSHQAFPLTVVDANNNAIADYLEFNSSPPSSVTGDPVPDQDGFSNSAGFNTAVNTGAGLNDMPALEEAVQSSQTSSSGCVISSDNQSNRDPLLFLMVLLVLFRGLASSTRILLSQKAVKASS